MPIQNRYPVNIKLPNRKEDKHKDMSRVSDDATILKIKHEVLTEVAKLAFAGELEERKENIPFDMIPGPAARFRCCI